MKALTLTELKQAIAHLETKGKKINGKQAKGFNVPGYNKLLLARDYLEGTLSEQPQDPREILTSIGWKW